MPHGIAIGSGHMIYGTTYEGGTNGNGTIYAVNTDGTGFAILHTFSATSTLSFAGGTNGDGANPLQENFLLLASTLYGTTINGGTNSGANQGQGVVFALSTNGTSNGAAFQTLYTFNGNFTPGTISTNNSGATPSGGLTISGETLYGTTVSGGSNGNGIIFAIGTNGTSFTNLHEFAMTQPNRDSQPTNSDGTQPLCSLLLSNTTLYGTAAGGSAASYGTLFAINTDGTGFTNFYNFGTGPSSATALHPESTLVLAGNTLYGTTFAGVGLYGGAVYGMVVGGSDLFPTPLNIQMSGASVELTWNSDSPFFSLQASHDATGPFTNIAGATSPYLILPTAAQQFFRLVGN